MFDYICLNHLFDFYLIAMTESNIISNLKHLFHNFDFKSVFRTQSNI